MNLNMIYKDILKVLILIPAVYLLWNYSDNSDNIRRADFIINATASALDECREIKCKDESSNYNTCRISKYTKPDSKCALTIQYNLKYCLLQNFTVVRKGRRKRNYVLEDKNEFYRCLDI